jgi:phenylpropionate dioxygenase-like ring-hydroxylating dioxygenase large terminal subunit
VDGGWIEVARTEEVTTRPRSVRVGDEPVVLVRLTAGGPPVAFPDRCPHRLVPLSAATVVAGTLQCAYHGWRFDAGGRCVELPSRAPEAPVPPRSHLPARHRVREAHGAVYVRADAAAPGAPVASLSNVDEALKHAWHPVALASEVGPDGFTTHLLGAPVTLRRDASGALRAEPAPHGLQERWGLVWLAPAAPLTDLFTDPDAEDEHYVGAWLPPATTNVCAGLVADNFLDVAHFPFVHAGTFGAGEEKVVPPYAVLDEPDGCRSIQEQWFDNPEDPGVRTGARPVRQRRRATYIYRAPFQLMLRLEELDAGAVKTILFFAQPETLTRTRVYTKMLLHGIGGVARPGPAVVAREVAFEEAVLAEDLALQAKMTLTGLPLVPRDELHVKADRLGVALRRCLREFSNRAGARPK